MSRRLDNTIRLSIEGGKVWKLKMQVIVFKKGKTVMSKQLVQKWAVAEIRRGREEVGRRHQFSIFKLESLNNPFKPKYVDKELWTQLNSDSSLPKANFKHSRTPSIRYYIGNYIFEMKIIMLLTGG